MAVLLWIRPSGSLITPVRLAYLFIFQILTHQAPALQVVIIFTHGVRTSKKHSNAAWWVTLKSPDLYFFFFQVSWIRHSNSKLLAVNSYIYTQNHRVKVFHENSDAKVWKLSLNPVIVEDQDLYECQVSTTPTTAHFMAVEVVGKSKMFKSCANQVKFRLVF